MCNITGTFLVNWKFILQFQWAAPLNLPLNLNYMKQKIKRKVEVEAIVEASRSNQEQME